MKTPNAGGAAPPGYYMLFVMSANGKPSMAEWVKLSGDANKRKSRLLKNDRRGSKSRPAREGNQAALSHRAASSLRVLRAREPRTPPRRGPKRPCARTVGRFCSFIYVCWGSERGGGVRLSIAVADRFVAASPRLPRSGGRLRRPGRLPAVGRSRGTFTRPTTPRSRARVRARDRPDELGPERRHRRAAGEGRALGRRIRRGDRSAELRDPRGADADREGALLGLPTDARRRHHAEQRQGGDLGSEPRHREPLAEAGRPAEDRSRRARAVPRRASRLRSTPPVSRCCRAATCSSPAATGLARAVPERRLHRHVRPARRRSRSTPSPSGGCARTT